MIQKRIPLTGIRNARDLGGHRTKDGRFLREHRLIRSGALTRATKEDIRILTEEYGVHTIVDFRTLTEYESEPDPEIPGVRMIHDPILKKLEGGLTRQTDSMPEYERPVEMMMWLAEMLGGKALDYMTSLYPVLVTDEHCVTHYKSFFELLLSNEEGAVLWHCTAGKDRAGTGAALVLCALGVDEDVIIENYLYTNDCLEEETAGLLEEARAMGAGAELLEEIRILNSVDRRYLEKEFETMRTVYGSMEAFLKGPLGLTEEKLERLQELYLEP